MVYPIIKPATNPTTVHNQAWTGDLSVNERLTILSGKVIQAAIQRVGNNNIEETNN